MYSDSVYYMNTLYPYLFKKYEYFECEKYSKISHSVHRFHRSIHLSLVYSVCMLVDFYFL